MKLVENAPQAWRMLSVQLSAIGATMAAIWLSLNDEQRAAILAMLPIPPEAVTVAGFVAVAVARVIAQPGLHK